LINDQGAVAAAGKMQEPVRESHWAERAWHQIAHGPSRHSARGVRWLPTFNLLVDRSAFEAVQGFDESLATCEDCALGYKLNGRGRLVFDGHTEVVHLGQSNSLVDLFYREAWRTRGNWVLALKSPLDLTNWASLLMPPLLVAGFVVSFGGTAAAVAMNGAIWPWLALLAAVFAATAMLVLRKTMPTSLLSFAQLMCVYATYLAGRTAGLVWPFRRLER
jgi:hypothetical protein